MYILGSTGGSVVKNLPAKAGDADLIPGLGKSPGERNSNPLQYSCLEKSHEQRSLVGDTAKEWDWTEHPHRQQMEIQR